MYNYNYNILIAVSVVVIIIAVYFGVFYRRDNLNGFWIIAEEFKQEAQLDNMILYFKDDTLYIVMLVNGENVVNDLFNFDSYQSGRIVHLKIKDPDKKLIIPTNLQVELYKDKGYIILKDKDTVYAKLFRDNQMSNTISIEPNKDTELLNKS